MLNPGSRFLNQSVAHSSPISRSLITLPASQTGAQILPQVNAVGPMPNSKSFLFESGLKKSGSPPLTGWSLA